MARRRKYNSRLQRRESSQQWRVAFFWILLTGIVIVGLVRYGVPLFIRLATWYSDYRAGENPIVQDDNVPPAPPRIRLPFTATNSATLDLSGFAEASSKVTLYLNQKEIRSVVTDAEGRFLLSEVELEDGYNSIYATATDNAQNVSSESRRQELIYDDQPPKLSISTPADGSKFYGSGQRRIEVQGVTDEEAQVQLNGRSMIVMQDGSFSTWVNLDEGEQVLEVKAIDEAGNETVDEVTVEYYN